MCILLDTLKSIISIKHYNVIMFFFLKKKKKGVKDTEGLYKRKLKKSPNPLET